VAGAVRPELDVPHLERHEFTAPRQRFVGDSRQRALAIRSQPPARARNELLDLVATQSAPAPAAPTSPGPSS
jgi:hypothetical protein